MSAQQTLEQSTSVTHPIAKAGTALVAGFGVSSWSDLAALAAFVYTLCLIAEWLWKKCGRTFFENRGWLPRRKRRATDVGG